MGSGFIEFRVIKPGRDDVAPCIFPAYIRNQRPNEQPGDRGIAVRKHRNPFIQPRQQRAHQPTQAMRPRQTAIQGLNHGQTIGRNSPVAVGAVQKYLCYFRGKARGAGQKIVIARASKVAFFFFLVHGSEQVVRGQEERFEAGPGFFAKREAIDQASQFIHAAVVTQPRSSYQDITSIGLGVEIHR